MLNVVKVGGRVAADAHAMAQLGEAIAQLPGRVVVVHGGGAEITELHQRLGIEVRWRDGLRVTTEEGVWAASMALSGWTNKRLVSALHSAGLQAVGLSGEDGSLVTAFLKDAGALGEVGTVAAVQPAVLMTLIAGGFIPVVSPISAGPGGRPLNVNADEVAGALAIALHARRLYLVSDAPGVIVRGGVVDRLELHQAESLLDTGVAVDGMRVKLDTAIRSARAGVDVRIGTVEVLGSRSGTRIRPARPVREVA